MKKRFLAFLLTFAMIFSSMPLTAFAEEEQGTDVNATTIEWAGAANYNDYNNQVTNIEMPSDVNYTAEKWAYPLNISAVNFGAYYAGQTVIIDGYLYATGGGKLQKVNIENGKGEVIADSVGTTGNYYDYLCYADGILIVATQTKLEAFDLTGKLLGSVTGKFGMYHPVQYHDGYIICNGFIYKLDRSDDAVAFTQIGDSAVGGDTFNWSSGVFLNGNFYVVAKTTVYAVDYKTGAVTDFYEFDAVRTANNGGTQGGVVYDSVTGRLFWGTYSYNAYIHSIKIADDGKLDKESYMSSDAGEKTVCTPVVNNGKVYLTGQSSKFVVLNANDLSVVYSVSSGSGKIQSNPIVSVAGGVTRVYAQGVDGHIYMLTDNGESGTVQKLASTRNYTSVQYPNAYDQIAIDKSGNIYCYNESGYLFCFTQTKCEVPSITTDLSTEQVKYAKDSATEPLTVEANVGDGGVLSYQWQCSTDKVNWTDLENAQESSYTPETDDEGTYYYRCIVTNNKDENTASSFSSIAKILVKILSSDTTLNVMVNGGNSATSSNPQKAETGSDGNLYVQNRTAKVTNIWVGTVDEGTVDSFEILQGLGAGSSQPSFTKKTSSNVYGGTTYNGYYRYGNGYTLPMLAKAVVTAEDGVTQKTYYIVVDSASEGEYEISINDFSADNSEYFDSENGITFTAAEQTVKLTPEYQSIGSDNGGNIKWTWSSSDEAVAKVDENGLVTSVGSGTASITASYGNIFKTCQVTSINSSSGAKIITVAAYDYTAVEAGLPGASTNGIKMKTRVIADSDDTAKEIVAKAFEDTGVSAVGVENGYVTDIGGLVSGTGGGYSGWYLGYYNAKTETFDDFSNYGLEYISPLNNGDRLEFHYSVNPDEATDDIGNGFYGKPILNTFKLADGQKVSMSKITTYDNSDNATTKYYINKGNVNVEMTGSGVAEDPFVVDCKINANSDISAQTAEFTTDLNSHYYTIVDEQGNKLDLTKPQDYTNGLVFRIASIGGSNEAYYKINVTHSQNNGGSSSSDDIKVSFRLIGAPIIENGIDYAAGKTNSQYVNWVKTKTVTLDKNSTVGDLFEKVMESAGLDYEGLENNYISTIYAPEALGGYALSELTNGPRSGWMYTVNGSHVEVALNDCQLSDGDEVIWHYVNDYGYEVEDWSKGTQGNEAVWNLWLKVADTNPGSTAGSGSANTGDQAVDNVISLINAIGTVDKNSGEKITAARTAYDKLTDAQKKLVTNYSTLTKAEADFAALNGGNAGTFADVPADHWAADAIDFVVKNNLFQGTSDNTFEPETAMNRAMLVTVLWRLEGKPAPAAEGKFSDVKAGSYYADAVAWANENGIVTGYENAQFGPEDKVTREQMAAVFARYAEYKGYDISQNADLGKYADAGKISAYAKDSLEWANAVGLITGRTYDTLAPQGDSTRAEVATMFWRFVNNIVK